MNGLMALMYIREGKAVRRKSWEPGAYIKIGLKHDPQPEDEHWYDITSLSSSEYIAYQKERIKYLNPEHLFEGLITHVIVDFFSIDWEVVE